MGMVHRVAMRIVELPKEQREVAIQTARRSIKESAVESGLPVQLAELCADGIEVVVREIEASGLSGGGRA